MISMRIKLTSFATTLSTVLLALAVNCLPSIAQEVEAGLVLVQNNCARCHAVTKTDVSAHEQAPPFNEVVTRYPPSSLAEALAEGISTGHADMPEFVFSPDQIGDLIAYLESLQ